MQWAMRRLSVQEWLARVIMNMYEGSRDSVRINGVLREDFTLKVGVHQGSVLSPLLFTIVLETLSSSFGIGLP